MEGSKHARWLVSTMVTESKNIILTVVVGASAGDFSEEDREEISMQMGTTLAIRGCHELVLLHLRPTMVPYTLADCSAVCPLCRYGRVGCVLGGGVAWWGRCTVVYLVVMKCGKVGRTRRAK